MPELEKLQEKGCLLASELQRERERGTYPGAEADPDPDSEDDSGGMAIMAMAMADRRVLVLRDPRYKAALLTTQTQQP